MKINLPSSSLRASAVLLCLTAPSLAQRIELDATMSSHVHQSLHLEASSAQLLDVPTTLGEGFTTEIELADQRMTLVTWPHSVRAEGFQAYVVGEDQVMRRYEAAAPTTFRGRVLEMPGSSVSGAILAGQMQATISLPGVTSWTVQPLTSALPDADPSIYVVYQDADVRPVEGVSCGTEDLPSSAGASLAQTAAGVTPVICEIACDSDQNFLSLNGGSIPNTITDIELIVNRMDDIYDNDVDVRFMVTVIIVRTTNGPYTSTDASTLLGQFQSHWNSTKSFVKRDIAHLFTGKNLNGSVIGVAFLGVVCSSNNGYGLSQSRFTTNLIQRTALTAHEVGHNYNAGHCSGGGCRIMCAALGGCSGILTSFGTTSANTIRSYAQGRPCLPDLQSEIALPFEDNFEGSLNTNDWPANQGGLTSTGATNEPSGTSSLNLDAANSTDEGQDRITSNFMLLAGLQDVQVSYWTQHKGVPSGGALRVEYRNSSGHWSVLNNVVSSGSDQTNFVSHTHTLPANAHHDEFQLRFTTFGGTGGSSDWYIDDVSVGGNVCLGPQNYCFPSPNSVSFLGSIIDFGGSSSLGSADLIVFSVNNPPFQNGLFFFGPNQMANPFGDGWLCVSGGITRMGLQQIDAFGIVQRVFNGNDWGFNPGDTTNVQFWFRDPAAGLSGFNLSDGLAIEWCE